MTRTALRARTGLADAEPAPRGTPVDRRGARERVAGLLVVPIGTGVGAVSSTYDPDTALSRLRRGLLPLHRCPSEVAAVLEPSATAERHTQGWFDPWAMPGGLDPTGLVEGWAAHRAVDVAVATSGACARGPLAVDPLSGLSAHRPVPATVVAPDLAFVDACAAAATAHGPAALSWLGRPPGVGAPLVALDGRVPSHRWWGASGPAAPQGPLRDGPPDSTRRRRS